MLISSVKWDKARKLTRELDKTELEDQIFKNWKKLIKRPRHMWR